ncbi:hypothetical protein J6590_090234, partial [Homalodisca vitripennis]
KEERSLQHVYFHSVPTDRQQTDRFYVYFMSSKTWLGALSAAYPRVELKKFSTMGKKDHSCDFRTGQILRQEKLRGWKIYKTNPQEQHKTFVGKVILRDAILINTFFHKPALTTRHGATLSDC